MTEEHRLLIATFRQAVLEDSGYAIEIAKQASALKLKSQNSKAVQAARRASERSPSL